MSFLSPFSLTVSQRALTASACLLPGQQKFCSTVRPESYSGRRSIWSVTAPTPFPLTHIPLPESVSPPPDARRLHHGKLVQRPLPRICVSSNTRFPLSFSGAPLSLAMFFCDAGALRGLSMTH